MRIRNSAKAVVVKEGNLLALKIQGNSGAFYVLPGGGQEHGETLHEALQRECMEELGVTVEIGDLLFVREYIGRNHEFSAFHSDVHQTEFLFSCTVMENEITNGSNPDKGQIGAEWIPVHQLMDYNLFPQALRAHLILYSNDEKELTYVGDIN
ncbi:NUDIX domain-containing protein [Sporosarcina sp. UB5]